MASMTVNLAVRPRGTSYLARNLLLNAIDAVYPVGNPLKNLPEETSISLTGSGTDLYQQLAAKSGLSIHRLRITKGSDGTLVPNARDKSIDSTGLREQSTIYVKDLGPQIAWRTVFIVEYLGPILIHPLLYILRPYIYKMTNLPHSTLQTLSLILITLHFLKRELETILIHRFSLATMPARNIFKNSAHYWLLAGLNIAYWIYSPSAPTQQQSNPLITYPAIALFFIGELGNFNSHMVLRNLRSTGGTERGIPQGLGFDLVTCPNYMFETIAWVGIWMATWSLSTGVFVVVAVAQMAVWARGKEMKLRKEFGNKYQRKRYAMIPGLF
ncbi:MAG: 3-oxo-5a-steroid 4- dehydrogenase [Pycnora praestabilis]|nr:MAG: 3-oxo-5a-steroid 4- dehydrogenase [Pycnora praestabilis]